MDFLFKEVNMPEGFDKCRREGGRIRTMKLKDGRYMHVCFDKQGKSHAGEIHTKQKNKEGR